MTVIANWAGTPIDPDLLVDRGYLTPITVSGVVYPRLLGYLAASLFQAQNTVFGTPGTAAPSNATPGADTDLGSSGSATTYSRGDHVHAVNKKYASSIVPLWFYATGTYIPGSGGDDYPAIAAAISALSAAGGGAVLLPPGNLKISQGVILLANVSIIGQGATIVPTATMSAMITISGGRTAIRDISLTNASNFATAGVKVTKGYDNYLCEISDLETVNMIYGVWVTSGDVIRIMRHWSQNHTTALRVDAGFLNSIVTDVYYLNGNGIDFGWPGMPGGQPSSATQPEGWKIIGGEILPYINGDFGIRVQSGLEGIIDDVTVDQIKKSGAIGISLDSSNFAIRAIKIHNSWTGINAGTTGTGPGIKLFGGASVQVIILNHTFDSHGTYGLHVDGVLGLLLDLQVAHCRFSGNTTGDVYLNNCRSTFIGNDFKHATVSIATAGSQVTVTTIGNTYVANPQVGTLSTSRGFHIGNTGNTNDSWDGSNANFGVNVRGGGVVANTLDALLALIHDSGTTSTAQLGITAISNPNGANLYLKGQGSTTPSKTLRVNSGHLQVMRDDYSASIFDLNDAGVLSLLDLTVNNTSNVAGAWTNIAVTIAAGSGTFTTASGVMRYKKIDRTVIFNLAVNITTQGTATTFVYATLPFTPAVSSVISGRDVTTGKAITGLIGAGNSTMILQFYDGTFPGASGSNLIVNGEYEANA